MAEAKKTKVDEPIPKGQTVFDNTWLWLALGIGVPTIFYILWGLADLLLVP